MRHGVEARNENDDLGTNAKRPRVVGLRRRLAGMT
jgi:hypothetical protein